MHWDLVDERFEMVKEFKKNIEIRRMLNYTKLYSAQDINKLFKFEHWDNGVYCAVINNKTFSQPFNEIVLLINPLNQDFSFEFDAEYTLMQIINNDKKTPVKTGVVPNISLSIYYR